jgi:hypothetical protein
LLDTQPLERKGRQDRTGMAGEEIRGLTRAFVREQPRREIPRGLPELVASQSRACERDRPRHAERAGVRAVPQVRADEAGLLEGVPEGPDDDARAA